MADLTLRQVEPDVVAMVVSGEWDLADEQDALRTWGAVLNSGSPGFLLDLEACTFMDSSALRMLFDINRAAEENELRWGVLGSGPAVRRLFDVTNAEEALPIVHDREAAMDLARPSRTRRAMADRSPASTSTSGG